MAKHLKMPIEISEKAARDLRSLEAHFPTAFPKVKELLMDTCVKVHMATTSQEVKAVLLEMEKKISKIFITESIGTIHLDDEETDRILARLERFQEIFQGYIYSICLSYFSLKNIPLQPTEESGIFANNSLDRALRNTSFEDPTSSISSDT